MAVPIQTRGHTDIRFTYENGTPDILYYLDVGSTVDGQSISSANPAGGTPVTLSGGQTKIAFQPTELITYIPNPSIARPSGTTWDFTGTSAGQPLWYIPQNQDTNKPWTGLSTESVSASNFSTIRYQLTAFNGPGQMSVTTTGSFGTPTVYFQTSNGLRNADAITISPNTHAHYNWFFTDAGVYTFELTATGTFTAAAGGGTTSVVDTFTFYVVPEPVSCLTMCIGIIGVLTSVVIHRLRLARTCR
jgi:surface-anchored protein